MAIWDEVKGYVDKALDGFIEVEAARVGQRLNATGAEQQNWGNPATPQNAQASTGGAGIPTSYLLIGGGVFAVGVLAFVFMRK